MGTSASVCTFQAHDPIISEDCGPNLIGPFLGGGVVAGLGLNCRNKTKSLGHRMMWGWGL